MMPQNCVRRLQRTPRRHAPLSSSVAVLSHHSAPSPEPGSLWEAGGGERAFPASTAQAGMQDGHARSDRVCCRLSARTAVRLELVPERLPNHAGGVQASALAEATPPWGILPLLVSGRHLGGSALVKLLGVAQVPLLPFLGPRATSAAALIALQGLVVPSPTPAPTPAPRVRILILATVGCVPCFW